MVELASSLRVVVVVMAIPAGQIFPERHVARVQDVVTPRMVSIVVSVFTSSVTSRLTVRAISPALAAIIRIIIVVPNEKNLEIVGE